MSSPLFPQSGVRGREQSALLSFNARARGHRPPTDRSVLRPEVQRWSSNFETALKAGYEPEEVARQVFEAIRDDQFYIFPAQAGALDAVKLPSSTSPISL